MKFLKQHEVLIAVILVYYLTFQTYSRKENKTSIIVIG